LAHAVGAATTEFRRDRDSNLFGDILRAASMLTGSLGDAAGGDLVAPMLQGAAFAV